MPRNSSSPPRPLLRRAASIALTSGALIGATAAIDGGPAALAGQQAAEQAAAAFDAAVELVTFSVSVLDENGAPVADLSPADFVVYEDGRRHEAALVLTPEATPLDIALLVDLSGSMRVEDWRSRAEEFLDALSERDCAFLLGFSTDVGGAVWGVPDDEILREALDAADAAGGTALFDAMLIGLRELDRSSTGGTLRGAARAALNPAVRGAENVRTRANNPCPAPVPTGRAGDPEHARRQALVIVSDGFDSTSRNLPDAVLTAAELGHVPIFPVQLSGGGGRPSGAATGGGGMGGGGMGRRRRNAAPLPEWAEDGVLEALADATGGKTVAANDAGYLEILAWLRGSYVVGYYTTAPRQPGSGLDFTRHEIEVELVRDDVEILHSPAFFRPTIDTQAARYEVEQARDLLAEGELEAAGLVLDGAIRADPGYAPAFFNRALVEAEKGDLAAAQLDAVRAAALSPGLADFHELAMLLSADVGDASQAWEQAIRAGQAGAGLRPHFEKLDAAGPAPADFDARLQAPRVMVARPYTDTTNLLMETALAKVLLAVRTALADAPMIGVVVDPALADFVMTIEAQRLSSQRPRRFEGRLEVADVSGKSVYRKSFLLEDVDSAGRTAENLDRFIRDLEDKLQR